MRVIPWCSLKRMIDRVILWLVVKCSTIAFGLRNPRYTALRLLLGKDRVVSCYIAQLIGVKIEPRL